jgi:hypothetical protein
MKNVIPVFLANLLLCLCFICLCFLIYCKDKKTETTTASEKPGFEYQSFRDSIYKVRDTLYDSTNVFDDDSYDPASDSLGMIFSSFDTLMSQIKRQDSLPESEKLALKENLAMLDSFYSNKVDTSSGGCKENECGLFVHVIKSRQILHLYINGEMKDSFDISTGLPKYSTPAMSMRPRGPVFMKYTSRKFPGGNYRGLGNMPYAVFIKGGYAIHGTTTGNLKKLGNQASHGCIRLHPDNARLFYELVKAFGLKNTWVKVDE